MNLGRSDEVVDVNSPQSRYLLPICGNATGDTWISGWSIEYLGCYCSIDVNSSPIYVTCSVEKQWVYEGKFEYWLNLCLLRLIVVNYIIYALRYIMYWCRWTCHITILNTNEGMSRDIKAWLVNEAIHVWAVSSWSALLHLHLLIPLLVWRFFIRTTNCCLGKLTGGLQWCYMLMRSSVICIMWFPNHTSEL